MAFAGWVSNRISAGFPSWISAPATVATPTGSAARAIASLSFDFSGAALRQTTRKVTRSGGEPDVRVLLLNDLRSVLLAGAEPSPRGAGSAALRARARGCLDADARRNLWRLCSMTLRRGGSLFLQYAAARPDLPETQLDGLVTRIDTEGAGARDRRRRGAGGPAARRDPGHDFFDHSDPLVARLEVRWDDPAPTTTETAGPTTPNPQEEQL